LDFLKSLLEKTPIPIIFNIINDDSHYIFIEQNPVLLNLKLGFFIYLIKGKTDLG